MLLLNNKLTTASILKSSLLITISVSILITSAYDIERSEVDRIYETSTKPGYLNLRIPNLNKYLKPFKNCLINLINYQGIDCYPFNYPVVLSRYSTLIQILDNGASKEYQYLYERLPKKNESITLQKHGLLKGGPLRIDNSLKARWYCLSTFYLYLPESRDANYKPYPPEHYFDLWRYAYPNLFHHTGFLSQKNTMESFVVFLTEMNLENTVTWNTLLNIRNIILNYYTLINILFAVTENIDHEFYLNILNRNWQRNIVKIWYLCQYCNRHRKDLI